MAWNIGAIVARFRVDTTQWRGATRTVKGDLRTISKEIMLLGVALTGFGLGVLREFGRFDRAIREALAVSTVTADQFREMSRMAEDMSVQINKAAVETAKGFYYLGSAGLTATEQMQSFATVNKMARAMTVDVGVAAEGLVDVMKGFNITFAESNRVADTLVKTVITSNQVFSELDKALSYISSTANLANNTLAETAAMLGVMANAGIKGSYAGVALRRSITNLMSPTSEMRDLMFEMGIHIYDATGRMKPFIQIVGELSDQLRGASAEYKNIVFEILFGRRAIAGQIKIFEYGSVALAQYARELANAGGTMDEVVEKQMKAFLHQIGRIRRQVQVATRSIGQMLVPAIQNLGDYIQPRLKDFDDWVNLNTKLITSIMKIGAVVAGLTAVLAPLMLIMPGIIATFTSLVHILVSPIGLFVVVLYTLRTIWGKSLKEMSDNAKGVFEVIGDNWNNLMDAITGTFGGAFDYIISSFIYLSKVASASMNVIANAMLAASPFTSIFERPGYMAAAKESMKNLTETVNKGMMEMYTPITGMLRGFVPYKAELKAWAPKLKSMMSEFTDDMKAQFKKDFASFIAFMQAQFPAFAAALEQLKNLWEIWFGPKGYFSGIQLPAWKFDFDNLFTDEETEKLNKLFKDLATHSSSAFERMWTESIRRTTLNMKKQIVAFSEMHQEMIDGWANAFDQFMQQGSSFYDFMDNIFGSVYKSFTRMVSQMLANEMWLQLFGVRDVEGDIVNWRGAMRLFGKTGMWNRMFGKPEPTYSNFYQPLGPMPEITTPGLGMFAGKAALPSVVLNITNEGAPVDVEIGAQKAVGDTIIVDAVMRAAETNTTFRRTFVNKE